MIRERGLRRGTRVEEVLAEPLLGAAERYLGQ